MIGYEFEFLVREGDRPLSRATFLKFHKILAERGWKPKSDPGTGGLVGSEKDGFFVTTDDGICTMELNTPPRETVGECHEQITRLLGELQSIYHELGCSIIGLSTFPGVFDDKNYSCKEVCLDEQCCEKSYIKYFNAQRFNKGHHALFVVAANQVWLDVEKSNLMEEWQTFIKATPFIMALFANGPIFNNRALEHLEGREILWRRMLNPSEVTGDEKSFGFPERPIYSLLGYFDYVLSMPFYFSLRDGKGFKLHNPRLTYRDFFFSENVEAQWFDGKPFTVEPTVEDFWGLQQKTFPHVRIKYRMRKGVTASEITNALKNHNEEALFDCFEKVFLECRALSAQPQDDLSAGPALLVGLQSNFSEFQKLMSDRSYEFWVALHEKVLRSGLGSVHDNIAVIDSVQQMLEIARRGLKIRGQEEEKFLEPLNRRLEKKQNPADEALQIWQKGGLESLWQARDFK